MLLYAINSSKFLFLKGSGSLCAVGSLIWLSWSSTSWTEMSPFVIWSTKSSIKLDILPFWKITSLLKSSKVKKQHSVLIFLPLSVSILGPKQGFLGSYFFSITTVLLILLSLFKRDDCLVTLVISWLSWMKDSNSFLVCNRSPEEIRMSAISCCAELPDFLRTTPII